MPIVLEAHVKIEREIDNEKKIKTFNIEGELDTHNVKMLKSEISEAIEQDEWTYVLNMQNVAYLDSSGLGMLVYIKKELHRYNSTLKIINLSDSVLNVFKMTKLDAYFGL